MKGRQIGVKKEKATAFAVISFKANATYFRN
jgi:hypothetical protein